MKRTLLASTAALLIAAPAFAADLPSRQAAPAPFVAPPAFTWTGFYAGVNAGWTQNEAKVTNRGFTGTGGAGAYPSFSTSKRGGFIGGLQAGYNQQFGNFVAGLEADINFLGNRRGTGAEAVAGLGAAGITGVTASNRLDWLGTVRARAGVAFDRVLVYGTAGLAFGAPDQRLTITNAAGGATHFGSKNETKVGWTVGGGIEYALLDNLTIRGEYLYYDLGRTTVTAAPTAIGPAGTANTARFENDGHIARVGLNYRF